MRNEQTERYINATTSLLSPTLQTDNITTTSNIKNNSLLQQQQQPQPNLQQHHKTLSRQPHDVNNSNNTSSISSSESSSTAKDNSSCYQRTPVSPLSRHKSLPNCNVGLKSQKEWEATLDRSKSTDLPMLPTSNVTDNTLPSPLSFSSPVSGTSSTNTNVVTSLSSSSSPAKPNTATKTVIIPPPLKRPSNMTDFVRRRYHHHKQASLPSSTPQSPSTPDRHKHFPLLADSLTKHSRSLESVDGQGSLMMDSDVDSNPTTTTIIKSSYPLSKHLYHSASQGSMVDPFNTTNFGKQDLMRNATMMRSFEREERNPISSTTNTKGHVSKSQPCISNNFEQLSEIDDFDPLGRKSAIVDNPIPKLQPPFAYNKRPNNNIPNANAIIYNNSNTLSMQSHANHPPTVAQQQNSLHAQHQYPQSVAHHNNNMNMHLPLNVHQHQSPSLPSPSTLTSSSQFQHHQHHLFMQQQQQQQQQHQALKPLSPGKPPQQTLMKGLLLRADKIPLCYDLKREGWDSDEEGEESLV